jgi:hypothetical protein
MDEILLALEKFERQKVRRHRAELGKGRGSRRY